MYVCAQVSNLQTGFSRFELQLPSFNPDEFSFIMLGAERSTQEVRDVHVVSGKGSVHLNSQRTVSIVGQYGAFVTVAALDIRTLQGR
jgi:hypothetical protein